MDATTLMHKKEKLFEQLKKYGSLAVAFSGGVDSTLLAAAARECLGDNALAVTAVTPLQSTSEIHEAILTGKTIGIKHYTVKPDILSHSEFTANPTDRCYICKHILGAEIRSMADSQGVTTVAHAVNLDDFSDYRPGIKAADEMGIAAPLADAQLTKAEIRELSMQMGLSTWNKPSAACLASRIPYGRPITGESLSMVEAAENVLAALGFAGVRVRHYGETAKIEVRPADFSRLLSPERRLNIVEQFRKIGFIYITMDLEGYRMGQLNRSINPGEESPST